MRFSNAATAGLLVTSAAFLGNAVADEIEDILGGEAETATTSSVVPTKSSVPKPDFTVSSITFPHWWLQPRVCVRNF